MVFAARPDFYGVKPHLGPYSLMARSRLGFDCAPTVLGLLRMQLRWTRATRSICCELSPRIRVAPLPMAGSMPAAKTAVATATKSTAATESTKAPSSASDDYRRPIIISPTIVGVRVSIIVNRIIRTEHSDGRRGCCRCHHLHWWLDSNGTTWRRRGCLQLLLQLIMLLAGLLLLQLAGALDQCCGYLLWHSQTLQEEDSIGAEIIRQGIVVDVIDDDSIVDASLVQLHHFTDPVSQCGNLNGAGRKRRSGWQDADKVGLGERRGGWGGARIARGSALGADSAPGSADTSCCDRDKGK